MSRVYVGNLPRDVQERELRDLFRKFDVLDNISIKQTPVGVYAFINFGSERDAEDAVRSRHNIEFAGKNLRVEVARGNSREGAGGSRYTGHHSDYHVTVEGIPSSANWQALKDFGREAGEVVYADVDHRGGGVLEYRSEADMRWALTNLHGKRLTSRAGESATVELFEDKGGRRGGDDRGRDDRSRDDRGPRDDDRSRDRDRDRDDRGGSREVGRERSDARGRDDGRDRDRDRGRD